MFTKNGSIFDDDLKLLFYGLYKQGTIGPCTLPSPSSIDFIAKAKWENWKQVSHLNQNTAKIKYVTLLSKQVPTWKSNNISNLETTNKSNTKSSGPILSRPVEEKYEGPKDICYYAQAGDVSKVEQLLSQGVDPDSTDEESLTPLMYACDRGYSDITIALLSHGAKLNIQDNNGDTALHYAVQDDNLLLIDLLLNKGADPLILNKDGESVIDVAILYFIPIIKE